MRSIEIGTLIDGKFQILGAMASGGMGDIYEALHLTISRRVVLKVLNLDLVTSKEMVKRFINEAHAANRIRHPAIVKITDRGALPDGRLYLVMEYLKGEDLGRRLKSGGRKRTEVEVVHWGWAIADAMAAAHAASIVHRDLKPGNVMLVPDDEAKLGERVRIFDFGIAKILDNPEALTGAAQVIGSPHYMAPEQFMRSSSVNDKADVYALGVMLYEMLTGRLPVGREDIPPLEMVRLRLTQEPPLVSSLVPEVNSELSQLVQTMLAMSRKQRPPMSEVAEKLRLLDGKIQPPVRAGQPPAALENVDPTVGVYASTIPAIPAIKKSDARADAEPAVDGAVTQVLRR